MNQNSSSQIQQVVKNELNQRNLLKLQNQNMNPNVQSNDLKSETLKINEIRKEISFLKSEQKKILNSISKSSAVNKDTNIADEERGRLESITARVNQMKDELIEIQKNDKLIKKELESKSHELSSNADEIEEAKKLANRIVKIVKGHDEKLKKLKDHIDFQDVLLSEITGRDVRMISSRPTTPK